MKRSLISILLLSTVYAAGPLNNYSFDAVYKNNAFSTLDYKDYLQMLKKEMELGLECQSDEDGSIIGGALASNDKSQSLQNAKISDYRQLFKELDAISGDFISSKDKEDTKNGIESGVLRTVSRLAAAARYYQKAVSPVDAPYLSDKQKNIDSTVAQILSGKQNGLSERYATPEEEERCIRLIYEQAHRSMANNLKLDVALQNFSTNSLKERERGHVATLRAIFCMAWLFHEGSKNWQDSETVKNMIGKEYTKHIDLDSITQKASIFDVFQHYKRFRDCYVDDQKITDKQLNKDEIKSIKWNKLTAEELQDQAWIIAKTSARESIKCPCERNTNHEYYAIDLLSSMIKLSPHVEPIAPNLFAYLSQIQRGRLVNYFSTDLIFKKFANSPQIYAVLPDFLKRLASRRIKDTKRLIGIYQIPNILKLYNNDADRMLSIQKGVVELLSNMPFVLSGTDLRDIPNEILSILNEPQSKAMQMLTKEQYQEILKAVFNEFNKFHSETLKEFSEVYKKFLQTVLLFPIKTSALETTATPVSIYHLQPDDFNEYVMQPLLNLCEKYPQEQSVTNTVIEVFAQLFSGFESHYSKMIANDGQTTISVYKTTWRHKKLRGSHLNKDYLQKIFTIASKDIDQKKAGENTVNLLNIMFARKEFTKKLTPNSVKKLFEENHFKLQHLLFNESIGDYVTKNELQKIVDKAAKNFGSFEESRFLATFVISNYAIEHLNNSALIAKFVAKITDPSKAELADLKWTDPNGLRNMIAAKRMYGKNYGILNNPNYEQYITSEQINKIIECMGSN